ncbi:hypothetical protein FGB62_66g134 [Gracilaria domingensis]|nr:hypothetical protein FGB62_66g134 [Gracilaria domingensis]
MSSCLRLSALQARLFPRYELEKIANHMRSMDNLASESRMTSALWESRLCLPSPLELLRALASVASSEELQGAFEGLKAWYLLLGTRILCHEIHSGYSSVPLLLKISSVLLDAIARTDSNRGMSKLVCNGGGEVAPSAVLLCVKRLRDCANSSPQDTPHLIGDVQYGSLLNGIVRAISGTIGVVANAVKARTALYRAFVICGPLAQTTGSEDVLVSSLGARFGQQHVSGTEGIISADAMQRCCVCAHTGSPCVDITVVSVKTLLDPVLVIPALRTQNRLSRVIQYSLLNAEVQNAMLQPFAGPYVPHSQKLNEDYAAFASVDSALCLVHSLAASGSSAGLIVDSGCMEALGSILRMLESRDGQKFLSLGNDFDIGASDEGVQASKTEQEKGNPDFDEMTDTFLAQKTHEKPRYNPRSIISTLVAVRKTVAAVVCCGGPTIYEGTVSAIGEGLNLYLGLLKTNRIATKDHLELQVSFYLDYQTETTTLASHPIQQSFASGGTYLLFDCGTFAVHLRNP